MTLRSLAIGVVCAGFLAVCGLAGAEEKLASHPPMRRNPPPSTNSIAADPLFLSVSPEETKPLDLRLKENRPAVNAGAALPEAWPDSRRREDAGKPDMGALPLGSKPIAVGRDAID